MDVKLLKATRPYEGNETGLLTFQISTPLYLWTEILTHRRFARNASSSRAMSTNRYVEMGYYTPPLFYKQGKGMMSSSEPIKHQRLARVVWHTSTKITHIAAKLLERLEVSKEQRNRLVAPNKIIRAIVTGTEDAWNSFLILRDHNTADTAMQILAQKIKVSINNLVITKTTGYRDLTDIEIDRWDYNLVHNPFPHLPIESSVANIARVSYARSKGKDDLALHNQLIQDKHFSPYEHIAEWKDHPLPSCLTTKKEDYDGIGAWQTLRASLGY